MSFEFVFTDAKKDHIQRAAREVSDQHKALTDAQKSEADAAEARLQAEHRLARARKNFKFACDQLLPTELLS